MKFTNKLAAICVVIVALSAPLFVANFAFADDTGSAQSEICQGLGEASGQCSSTDNSTIDTTLSRIISLLSIVAGFAGLVMIIVSAIRFITSHGDSSGIAGARQGLIYALVGLVIAALAQIIVHFVLGKTTGIK